MKRVDGVVGNVGDDPELAAEVDAHEAAGTLETVVLDDTERRRSRLRVTTDAGTEVGVLVDQPELTAGDVLLLTDDRAVVVAFERREAFVVELPAEPPVATAVELGHRIGNQHWDVAVDGETLYIPVEADRSVLESVLGPYVPADATTRYETVPAEQFIDDSQEDATPSDHGHAAGGTGHTHGHDEATHTHSHDHGEDDHTHGHGDEEGGDTGQGQWREREDGG